MEIIILGSGTCAVTRRRSCSSYYIRTSEQHILLDIGFGALRRMSEAGIDYREIDVVLCSHFHLDHIGDLAPLLMALRFTPGYERKKPLTLIGPQGFRDFLHASQELYGDWLLPRDEYPLTIYELNTEHLEVNGCVIRAMTMHHTPYTNGYRLEHQGKAVAYSADTGPCDELVELCKDADLAFVECSFPNDQPFEFHLTPQQAADAAQRAKVKHLILTHFYPMMDDFDVKASCRHLFEGRLDVAEDLARYTLS